MDALIIKKINLKAGEEIIRVVRHYRLTLWPQILAVILLLTLPFFFLFPLFRRGWWGVMIFLLLIVLGIIYGLRALFTWYFDALVITNKRIVDIDQRGFFERIVSEAPYEKIQDVSYRHKGVWQTLLRYGSVRIQTAGATVELEVRNVKNPEKVQEIIVDLAHLDKNRIGQKEPNIEINVPPPSDEELKIIKQSIDDLDERQLEELEGIVRSKLRQEKLKRLEKIKDLAAEE